MSSYGPNNASHRQFPQPHYNTQHNHHLYANHQNQSARAETPFYRTQQFPNRSITSQNMRNNTTNRNLNFVDPLGPASSQNSEEIYAHNEDKHEHNEQATSAPFLFTQQQIRNQLSTQNSNMHRINTIDIHYT